MDDAYSSKASAILNNMGGERTDRDSYGNKKTNTITTKNSTMTNCTAIMSHSKPLVIIE